MTELRHRPAALRLCRAVRAWALLALAAALATTSQAQDARARRTDLPMVTAQVIEQTNAFRSRYDLAPLANQTRLANSAHAYAEFMASEDQYGHEADGRTPGERLRTAGYEFCVMAENLAYVFSSAGFTTDVLASRLVAGWIRSPAHRNNMLLAAATETGVGLALSQRTQRYYAVQLFAMPRSAATLFEVVNRAGTLIRYELDDEIFELPVMVTRTHTRCTDGTLRLLDSAVADAERRPIRNGARYVATRDAAGQLRLQLE